jgi:hypothetical protein
MLSFEFHRKTRNNSDSEYMLDVAYGPILAEKILKNPFFGKIPKKGKTPPQKN